MPHCTLEFSGNVIDCPDLRRLFSELHDVLTSTGLFEREAIKSRAIRYDDYFIGDGDPHRAFVALDVSILSGRPDDAKARITEGALDLLKRHFAESIAEQICNITVQVSELHRSSYRRFTSEAAVRLR
jgi:5-carboxymethyl-2-hydroxymuconate isomerase